MNKIIFTLLMLMCSMGVSAKDTKFLKTTGGSVDVFYKEGKAFVSIDDIHAEVDKNPGVTVPEFFESKGEGKGEIIQADLERAHKSFTSYFNQKKSSKVKLLMSDTKEGTQYTIQVKVTHLHPGNGGGMVYGMSRKSGGMVINGTLKLIDNATGKVLYEAEINHVKGLLSPAVSARAISVYRFLAANLIKVVK